MISRRLLRIKVLKELYGYMKAQNTSLPNAEKELALSIRKTYDLYHYLFYFLPSLQTYAQNRIDLGRQKHRPTKEELQPNTRFVENAVIQQISENSDLLRHANQNTVQLQEAAPIIRKMYNTIVERDYYKAYMARSSNSYEDDRNLVIDILTFEFEGYEDLDILLEEQSIYWTDEMEFVVGMIIRTVKNIRPERPFKLLPLFKNFDDEEFAKRLFRHALINYGKYNELIGEFTPNWDVERIAFMDIVILVIAIAELLEFPDIPVKVTLDEYIDLARFYSTSNSNTFVNGVLDKLVQDFKSKNLLQKQGIGLIER